MHSPKLGVREEKSAQETPSWKRRERRRHLHIQRRVRGSTRKGAHQLYSSEGDCRCPIHFF